MLARLESTSTRFGWSFSSFHSHYDGMESSLFELHCFPQKPGMDPKIPYLEVDAFFGCIIITLPIIIPIPLESFLSAFSFISNPIQLISKTFGEKVGGFLMFFMTWTIPPLLVEGRGKENRKDNHTSISILWHCILIGLCRSGIISFPRMAVLQKCSWLEKYKALFSQEFFCDLIFSWRSYRVTFSAEFLIVYLTCWQSGSLVQRAHFLMNFTS